MEPPDTDLAVTVLGSGSPFPVPRRVSSGYLVWADGNPALLVDAGGGIFERLGRLEVDLSGLRAILLTHTHIDHTGGLPSVVFASYMQGRGRPLPLFGPAGREQHPGCERFAELLFGETGAWSYLRTFEGFAIEPTELPADPKRRSTTQVITDGELAVRSTAVPHGMMPSLAYRIDYKGHSVVFGGDIEGYHANLVALAQGCDVLITDQSLPNSDMEHGHLHPSPSDNGRMAAASDARRLLLTHFMPPVEDRMEEVVAGIRAHYAGEIMMAEDLVTFALS